jgi:hypothetical protein
MGDFVVYRHGKNSYNQMHSDRVPIAAVEAKSARHAIELVRSLSFTSILDGQYLSAVPRSELPVEEWETVAAMEFINNIILQHY